MFRPMTNYKITISSENNNHFYEFIYHHTFENYDVYDVIADELFEKEPKHFSGEDKGFLKSIEVVIDTSDLNKEN